MRGFAIISASLLLAGTVASAQPVAPTPAPAKPARSCFFVSEFDNWRASDPNTIYVRTHSNRYYRLDTSGACPALLWPDAHLIMNVRGPDTICTALDWDLKVSNGFHDIPIPCIIKTMTPLTDEQAAAIPKKFKP